MLFQFPQEQKPPHISVGAFFDRFGVHKYPILASTDPGVQALIKDCTVRSFIDLSRPDLPLGLGIITTAGFAINTDAILTNPIQEYERP